MKHVLIIVILFIIPSHSYGYLDPGVGSYFLQIALAFLFGSLYLVKIFWKNIVTFFRNLFSKKSEQEQSADD